MSYITAIGTANPNYKLLQSEIAEILSSCFSLKIAEKRLLKRICRLSGITYRHSVLNFYGDEQLSELTTAERMRIFQANALNLAMSAIHDCLDQVDIDKKNITHIITVSCTGMYAPGLEIEIVKHLGLNSSIQRHAVNFMGCYGVFNALKIAHAICRQNCNATILIVSVELCTLHFQKTINKENIISHAIFSDGAAAALIQSQCHNKKKLKMKAFHSELYPDASQHMTWQIGNSGFDIILSSYVPELIENGINKLIHGLLCQQDSILSPIDYYAIHPGGIAVLEACEKALSISPDQNNFSYEILKNFGNMSSATILFVLKKIIDTIVDSNKNILSCAFGPGITLESMLLET